MMEMIKTVFRPYSRIQRCGLCFWAIVAVVAMKYGMDALTWFIVNVVSR